MNDLLEDIINNLKEINVNSVILFGSFASETNTEDSDIDLIVILDSDSVSKSFEEKMKNKLLVRNCIYELSRKFAIDLIVYTKAEFNIIKENKTSFYNEILETGKVLYEKAS
jgi:uncharacterized protein